MGPVNIYFPCAILIVSFSLSQSENRSNIESYSTSDEIDSINASTEIHCDTDVKLHKISYNWNINRFDLHRPKGSENNSIISPTFSSATYDKVKWYLQIFPGNETSEMISIYLCLSPESKKTKARAKFEFEFLDSQRNSKVRFGDDSYYAFDHHDILVGWEDIELDDVVLPDNKLKIVCNITFCEYTDRISYSNQNYTMLHPECNLCQDFTPLIKNPEFSDVLLVLSKNGKEYPAHKSILAARSPAFAAMFKHHKEKKIGRVSIPDTDERVFDEILRYIYTGKCENIEKLAQDLLISARKLGLNGLNAICVQQIRKNLTIGNVADILLLADKHGLDELKSKAIRFIADNYAQVSNTTDWKHIVETNGKLVHEVCHDAVNQNGR